MRPLIALLLVVTTVFVSTAFANQCTLSPDNGDDIYPSVDFDVSLFPTITDDLDYRTYYQGTLTISDCSEKCVSATWNLTVSSTDFEGGAITDYVDNTKGSLTSWSYYLNSESLCSNTAPPSSPSIIQLCTEQQIDDKSEFSGQIRWLKGKKETKGIKALTFDLVVVISYDHDEDRETPPVPCTSTMSLTRDIVYVPNAGIVDYIGATKKANFHYTFATAFRTNIATNHFALRPFGALSHELFMDMTCTANGIRLSAPYIYYVNQDTASTPPPTHSMFAVYLFTLLPHELDPWVPYSRYQDLSNRDDQFSPQNDDNSYAFEPGTNLSILCDFVHPSRFYADELPYGLTLSINNFPSETPISAKNPEYIKTLLTASPTWTIPRFNVYNQLDYSKQTQIIGSYFSGTYPQQTTQGTRYYGDLSVEVEIKTLLVYECRNPTGQTQSGIGELLLSVFQYDNWELQSARYIAMGYDKSTPNGPPVYTLGEIVTNLSSRTVSGVRSFEPINLCPLFDIQNLSITRPIRITLQFSARYIGPTQPFSHVAEYPTPGKLSPAPFGLLITFRQTVIDTEKRVITAYQPLTISWCTNYQLTPGASKSYPLLDLKVDRRVDSTNIDFYSMTIGVEALSVDASAIVFWFPSGNWGFFGDVSEASCSMFIPALNGDWRETSLVPTPGYLLDFSTGQSGIAFLHPQSAEGKVFDNGHRYAFKCSNAFVKNATLYHHSHTSDTALSLFVVPSTPDLDAFLNTPTHAEDTPQDKLARVQKALSRHIDSYNPTHLPPDLNYGIPPPSTLTIPHYTQMNFSFPTPPTSKVKIIIIVVVISVVVIAAALGFFWWRRRQVNLRKAALMAYVDVYNDSVQEYM